MSKKHFAALAARIAQIRDMQARIAAATAVALACADENPRFAPARFYEACGLGVALAKAA